MAENSRIGWTHHTQNFWWGCDKVSAECANCYIGPIMRRGGREPFQGPLKTKDWRKPLRWNRAAEGAGVRRRVFTCSMSDFFHAGADAWRDEAWGVIRACQSLDWLILTKRIELVEDRLPADWGKGYGNVWLGVTCGVSSSLWRLDVLSKIPAAVRFVSAEPLLEPLDLRRWLPDLDWVISGGESGSCRRNTEVSWQQDLWDQCREYGVAFYAKQDTACRSGEQGRLPDELWRVKEYPAGSAYA